ncbi:UNVERIFIED_CONTAM: hypothetical protein FKN15_073435 [Acipenser sinensis]
MISPPPFPLCADARSLLEDSEELGDDDYQASKRELEAEDSVDSDAELDSDGLKGERELGESFEKHVWVVCGYNVKPSRGTHFELQMIDLRPNLSESEHI